MQDSNRIDIVDRWRGVAMLLVLWHHWFYLQGCERQRNSESLANWVHGIAGSGWLGVNVFFFVSGFLLWHACNRSGYPNKQWLSTYYRSRAIRLLPLYAVSATAALWLTSGLSTSNPAFVAWVWRYLSVSYIFSASTFQPIGNWVLWSLGVEIWVSLLVPALFLLLRATPKPQHALALVIVFSLLWRSGLLSEANHGLREILGRLDEFAWGMLAAVMTSQGSRCWRPSPTIRAVAMAGIPALFLLSNQLACGQIAVSWQPLVPVFLDACLFVTLVAQMTHPTQPAVDIHWLQSTLQQIGRMCFSIYVWHGMLLLLVHPNPSSPLDFAKYLAWLAVIATASYYLIEQKLGRWIKAKVA